MSVAVRVGLFVALKLFGVREGVVLIEVAVGVRVAVRVDEGNLVNVGVRELVGVARLPE